MLDPGRIMSELLINGEWVDITADVRTEDAKNGIRISRGKKGETGNSNTTCTFMINNHGGIYSDQNPLSPYFGLLGRNTRVRHSILGHSYLRTYGGVYEDINNRGDYAETPHSAVDNTFDDMELIIDFIPLNVDSSIGFACKYEEDSGNESWAWYWDVTVNQLVFYWKNTTMGGGPFTATQHSNTLPFTLTAGNRYVFKVVYDPASEESDVHFYYAQTVDGPWTLISSHLAVPVGIKQSTTEPIRVGSTYQLGPYGSDAKIYEFRMTFSTIDVVLNEIEANPIFGSRRDSESFTDDYGRFWEWGSVILSSNQATLVPNSVRCDLEIASFPQEWDITGSDFWCTVEAADVYRRLGSGSQKPTLSVLQFAIQQFTSSGLVHHWPLNDGSNALVGAPVMGNTALSVVNGKGRFGSQELAKWIGTGVSADDTGELQLTADLVMTDTGRWVFTTSFISDTAVTSRYRFFGTTPASASTTRYDWELVLDGPGGQVELYYISNTSTTTATTNVLTVSRAIFDGLPHRVEVAIIQGLGTNVNWEVNTDDDENTGNVMLAGLWQTINLLTVRSTGTAGVPNAISNMAIWDNAIPGNTGVWLATVNGWAGLERVPARLERLFETKNITYTTRGKNYNTAVSPPINIDAPICGPQYIDTFIGVIEKTAFIDQGILTSNRSEFGAIYLTREFLTNQENILLLDYASHHLSPPFKLRPDDLYMLNDSTVTIIDGSSYRSVVTSGRLSVNEPPNGVGTYDEEQAVSMHEPHDALNLANFRTFVGTQETPRYSFKIELHRTPWESSFIRTQQIFDLDEGSAFRLTGLPFPPIPPEDLLGIVSGYDEHITNLMHEITFHAIPGNPYQSEIIGSGLFRVCGNGDIVLASSVNTTDTTFTVESVSGFQRWGTPSDDAEAADDFPHDAFLGGERVTVISCTALTGGTQDLTVTRSVNGIVKAHTAGTPIDVYDIAVVGWDGALA